MITIGIIDDEQVWQNKTASIIMKNFENVEIYTYDSVNQIDRKLDFILLDIEMPDMDGITFAKENPNYKIIFVTNYDTSIKQSSSHNVYGYVSKDKLDEELILKVKAVIEDINNNYLVTFKVDGVDIDIKIDDIYYCQHIGYKKIAVIYGESKIILKSTKFKDMLNYLGEKFIAVNRHVIINNKKILNFDAKYVYLKGINSKFKVSEKQRDNIKKYFYRNCFNV